MALCSGITLDRVQGPQWRSGIKPKLTISPAALYLHTQKTNLKTYLLGPGFYVLTNVDSYSFDVCGYVTSTIKILDILCHHQTTSSSQPFLDIFILRIHSLPCCGTHGYNILVGACVESLGLPPPLLCFMGQICPPRQWPVTLVGPRKHMRNERGSSRWDSYSHRCFFPTCLFLFSAHHSLQLKPFTLHPIHISLSLLFLILESSRI